MDPVQMALYVVVIPAATTTAVLLATRLLTRSRKDAAADLGPALGAGFVAGFLGVAGLPKFPPLEAWQWLLTLALAGTALAIVDVVRPALPTFMRWTLRAAPLLFAVWTTLLDRTLPALAVLVAGIFVFAWTVDRLAARTSASAFLVTLLVVATATSVSLVVSNTMLLGQLCGSLAAASAVGLALSWRLPVGARGAVALVALLLAGLWMNGVLFAELPIASATLLAAVPLAAWLVDAVVGSRLSPRRLALARTAAAVVVAGAAVAVAVANSAPLDY